MITNLMMIGNGWWWSSSSSSSINDPHSNLSMSPIDESECGSFLLIFTAIDDAPMKDDETTYNETIRSDILRQTLIFSDLSSCVINPIGRIRRWKNQIWSHFKPGIFLFDDNEFRTFAFNFRRQVCSAAYWKNFKRRWDNYLYAIVIDQFQHRVGDSGIRSTSRWLDGVVFLTPIFAECALIIPQNQVRIS